MLKTRAKNEFAFALIEHNIIDSQLRNGKVSNNYGLAPTYSGLFFSLCTGFKHA
jgi:hypothetical protein